VTHDLAMGDDTLGDLDARALEERGPKYLRYAGPGFAWTRTFQANEYGPWIMNKNVNRFNVNRVEVYGSISCIVELYLNGRPDQTLLLNANEGRSLSRTKTAHRFSCFDRPSLSP
jgi:hypothetical protein